MDLITATYIKNVMEMPFEKRQQYLEALSKYIFYMGEMNRVLLEHSTLKRAVEMAADGAPGKDKLN